MAIPDRDQLLTLDYHYNGLPFGRVVAKSGLDSDATFKGLPFLATDGESGPPEPAAIPPLYILLAQSSPPDSATTLARETGDILLMGSGFTLIEEDETLDSGLATIELFTDSTPTTGTWVIDTDYRTNAATDGVLRSPLPTTNPADESAYLTVVTTAPRTQISFDWGVRGMAFFDPADDDTLKFSVDGVELLVARPSEDGGDAIDLATGSFAFVVTPGTYELRWRWHRPTTFSWYPLEAHAWITALLIDPTY